MNERADRSRRRLSRIGVLAAVGAAASVLGPAPTGAQEGGAPLLTVSVDATDASLTDATYELVVANHGSAPANGVALTNHVPANMSVSASDRQPLDPSACGPGGACRWDLGELAAGSSEAVRVTYGLEESESAYPTFNPRYTFANSASVQVGMAAPVSSDPRNTDRSLARFSFVLEDDAYTDRNVPEQNFGGCDQLSIRRDNSHVAFVDNDAISSAFQDNLADGLTLPPEIFAGAELRAVVASAPDGAADQAIPVTAHRVVSHDWSEGTACGGPATDDRDVTAANRPISEESTAASAPLSGPGPVSWDVREALDEGEERATFSGFELRAGDSPGAGGDGVAIHSSEATVDLRPRLVAVAVMGEPARCIDHDPEESASPSDGEPRVDAYVTDSVFRNTDEARVKNAAGDDACPGSPVPDVPVGWTFDDDSPDAYISDLAGTPAPRGVGASGDAGPNAATTRTDAQGGTFIRVKLAEPYSEGQNSGENRIAAILLDEDHNGRTDEPSNLRTGTCEPGTQVADGHWGMLPTSECNDDGENGFEDDVTMTWHAAARPQPSPPPAEPPPGGGVEEQPPGPMTPANELPAAPSRSLALGASRSRVRPGDDVTLFGELSSSIAECADAGELIQLWTRAPSGAYEGLATVVSERDGRFELPTDVTASAEYVAVAAAHDNCVEASSGPAAVTAMAKVLARPSAARTRRGSRVVISGRVLPDHENSEVVLQRQAGARWSDESSRALNAGPQFRFVLRASWRGSRKFRIIWVSTDDGHRLDSSAPLKVTTRH